ncbi:SVM family protein [Candidatus Phytoplasma asiaticum]|uniref:SVM family protein n=1 Tax=Candidatus Phytoplasma asiaticum TaxID=2763338 RepID=A0AAX3B8I2_9MOLU|nr:SVM family protein ['Parthenium hysterophorus' phyllody phytoplasma]UQV27007.1 SVM family protein ['Parthenium hysterophorus' phyllody phytoplasma]
MFKLQNKLKIIIIYLFIFFGLFLINNNQVMATENNNSLDLMTSEHLSIINDNIWHFSVRKQKLFILSSSCKEPKTKSILNKRYFCCINLIKNLEEQRNLIINRGYYNNPILIQLINQLINDFNQQLLQLNRNC